MDAIARRYALYALVPTIGLMAINPSAMAFALYDDRVKVNAAGVTVPDPYFWGKCVAPNLNGGACTLNVTFSTAGAKPWTAPEKAALNNAVTTWQTRAVPPAGGNPNNIGQMAANDPTLQVNQNQYDLASALLHELGHSLGLDHPAMGRERQDQVQTPMGFGRARYTAADDGANGRFEFGAGADGVSGTADDLRGDDQSRQLVDADNNPFNAPVGVVDGTTFTYTPVAGAFAQTSTREVANKITGQANLKLESVMVQDFVVGETRRLLTYDDVNGLAYLQAGPDQTAATAADNFVYNLVYNNAGAPPGPNQAPPAGIDIFVSGLPSLGTRPVTEPILNRTGDLFQDVIISLLLGFPTESDMLYGNGSPDVLARSETWLDNQGNIGFVDIYINQVPAPGTLGLCAIGLFGLARALRRPSYGLTSNGSNEVAKIEHASTLSPYWKPTVDRDFSMKVRCPKHC